MSIQPSHDLYERFVADAAENTQMESHWLKANSPDGQRAIWIRHELICTGPTWVERDWHLWFMAFERDGRSWIAKEVRPWAEMTSILDGPRLVADGLLFEAERARGRLGSRSWDLILTGGLGPVLHLPLAGLYSLGAANNKVLTPASALRFAGEVSMGETTWSLEGWRGMRGHTWGPDFPERYAWLATHVWDDGSERSAEGFTARSPFGMFGPRYLNRSIVQGGGDDTAWLRRAEWPVAPGTSAMKIACSGLRGGLTASAPASSFVHLRYEGTDGRPVLCRSTLFAEVQLETRSGTRTSRCGHLEFLDRSMSCDGMDAWPPRRWTPRDGVFEDQR
jgi:hypothetical protein